MTLPAHAASQQMWATSFYAFRWKEHDSVAPELISTLYEMRDAQQTNIESGIAPSAKSASGLFEGDFDLLAGDHDGLRQLREFITTSVRQAVIDANKTAADSKVSVEICDSWYHITNDGGFHDSHFHSHCSWCGIYYVQIGDSGNRSAGSAPNGGNRFYSPLSAGGRYEDFGNSYLSGTYLDPPISDGMLLLFPSYLMHSGLPYRGNKDRIVVSVNTRSSLD